MAVNALELTRELIRFDTINPPGQEQQPPITSTRC